MSDIEAVQNVMFYQRPYERELGGHHVVSSMVRFQYKANSATFSVVQSFVETLQVYLKESGRLDPGSELSMDARIVTEQILASMEASLEDSIVIGKDGPGIKDGGLYSLVYERLEDARKEDTVEEVFSLVRTVETINVSTKLDVACLPKIEVQENVGDPQNSFVSFYIDRSTSLHHRMAMLTWLEERLVEYWCQHLTCRITVSNDDLQAMYAVLRTGILGVPPVERMNENMKNGYMAVILLSQNPGYRLVEYRSEGLEAARVILSHSF